MSVESFFSPLRCKLRGFSVVKTDETKRQGAFGTLKAAGL